MRHHDSPGLTMLAALVLGFGATFGLWLFAGYYFTQRIADVQREAIAINRRYMEAQELLARVRTEVLLGSLSVRDTLLEPEIDTVAASRLQVEQTYAGIDTTLKQYVPILDSAAERARVESLRREIAGFRDTLLNVLAMDPHQLRSQARYLLRQMMPRRASVMEISDDFQKLNRGAFVQQQQATAQVYAATQDRVWQMLTFALAASVGIALFATLFVTRLGRDLQRQRQMQLATTEDLQRLSTKLVTVQEEERRKIARDLHDEVGQLLMAMKVELALEDRRVQAGGSARLTSARAIADTVLNTVRDLSRLLHPALLDDLGLPAALDSYLAEFGKRHGIGIEFRHDGMNERLSPVIETAVYRIVQEALTNVVKHAQATLASVYIRHDGHLLQVNVKDNGIGFDPATAHRGLGLIGIRERVTHLHGEVHFDSSPGVGTRVTVTLPARHRAPVAETVEESAVRGPHTTTNPSPEGLIG